MLEHASLYDGRSAELPAFHNRHLAATVLLPLLVHRFHDHVLLFAVGE